MKYILFFFLILTSFIQAQTYPVNKDVEVYQGDYTVISFTTRGNVSSDSLVFTVKADRADSTNAVIQRKNTAAGGDNNQIQVMSVDNK